MTRFISLVSFPVFLGLLATANELIPLVFGDKWDRAIIPLQIIICFSLIRSFASPAGGIVTALGKPSIEFTFNLIQAPILLVGVLVGIKYGIIGVAVAMSLVVGIMALLFLKVSISLIDLRLRNIFEVLFPAFLSSSLMMTLVLIVRGILLNQFGYKDYQVLLVCVPFGVMVYLGILFLFFRRSFLMFWNMFMDIIGSRLVGIKKIYPAFGSKTAID
jgi:O-antigen/teichoic acid export membrane protein